MQRCVRQPHQLVCLQQPLRVLGARTQVFAVPQQPHDGGFTFLHVPVVVHLWPFDPCVVHGARIINVRSLLHAIECRQHVSVFAYARACVYAHA